MNNAVETIKLKDGTTLNIYQDTSPFSPREWDNLGTMVCFHNKYNLGDEHVINKDDYNSFEEMIEDNVKSGDITLSLYLYDHSGLSISTEPFGCRWDSGQVGYITISKEKIIREYGNNDLATRVNVMKYLKNEVKTYNQYLTGSVYGFTITEEETCSLGHVHENELEACWGFYGSDHEQSGLYCEAGYKKENVA